MDECIIIKKWGRNKTCFVYVQNFIILKLKSILKRKNYMWLAWRILGHDQQLRRFVE